MVLCGALFLDALDVSMVGVALPMIAVAFACLVAGYALFLRIGPHPDYPAVILPSVLLIGAAFGLGFSALNIQATSGVANQEQGLASGILQTSFQVGGAIVLAIVTAIVDAGGANRVVTIQALTAYRPRSRSSPASPRSAW